MQRLFIFIAVVATFLTQAAWYCRATEAREGYVRSSDGVRIFYKVVGSGLDTLVVVHGGPGNTMNSILPDLEPLSKDHIVIYYDQRGNGRSDLVRDGKALEISRHIDDLEAIRHHFHIKKLTLLGNSWGGLLAGYYAVAHPDQVEKLVLNSAAPPSIKLLSTFAGRIHQRIPEAVKNRFKVISNPDNWVNAPDPRAVCREFFEILKPLYFAEPARALDMRGDVCAGSDEAVRYQQTVNKLIWQGLGEWDILPKLPIVKAPVLIIQGKHDMLPPESSRAWAKALPNARLLIIDDAGHMTQVEQPDIFFPAVETFLRGELAGRSEEDPR